MFLLIPALLLLALRRGKGSEAAVVFPNLSVLVSLGKRVRRVAWSLGLPLAFLALFCAILAMARPVWRNEYQSRSASGIDIMIAFDVSLSMDIDDFVDQGDARRSASMSRKKSSMISSAAARMTGWAWSPSPAGRATPARSRSITNG